MENNADALFLFSSLHNFSVLFSLGLFVCFLAALESGCVTSAILNSSPGLVGIEYLQCVYARAKSFC